MMKNKKTVNGKVVNDWELVWQGDCGDDSFISAARFEDGTELNEEELEQFEKDYLPNILWG